MHRRGTTQASCFVDESGFVGFAETERRLEPDSRAFGLIAGLLLPDESLIQLELEVAVLFSGIEADEGVKLHASEVFAEGANCEIRDGLFEYLADRDDSLIVYEAVYAKGVLEDREALNAIVNQACGRAGDSPTPGNASKTRLLIVLLRGLIFQLDTICQCSGVSQVMLLSDTLDKGVLKEAKRQLCELRSDTTKRTIRHWSKKTGLVEGTFGVRVSGFDNRTSRVSEIDTDTAHPNLVLAADIVANSLYHHLGLRISKSSGYPALHDQAALKEFPLKRRVANLHSGFFTDLVFRPSREHHCDRFGSDSRKAASGEEAMSEDPRKEVP